MKHAWIGVSCVGVLACGVLGNNNPAGSPPLGGPMSHLLVTVVGQNPSTRLGGEFFTGFESPGLNPVSMIEPPVTYDGGATVLNGSWFNAQYGWLVSGFWGLPAGSTLWVRVVDQTPGLETYAGRDFNGYLQYEPLFGTAGSSDLMAWDGTMLHNYYAVRAPGSYSATYEVFVGDDFGVPWLGAATPATITIDFNSDGPQAACLTDLDNSGVTDLADLLAVLAFFGGGVGGDVNSDGVTDLADLLGVLASFGDACP